MHSHDAFDLFFHLVKTSCCRNEVDQPSLPQKHRAPQHLEVGSGECYHRDTVEYHYHYPYFEAIDLAISSIKDHFEQPGYIMYWNLDDLLLNAANQKDYTQQLHQVTEFYADDVQPLLLSAQLQNLGTCQVLALPSCP